MPVAKRLEDLIIWTLACELRDGIADALAASPVPVDPDFYGQITRSSRSVPSNLAEGFGHFKPTQFARYLRIARASAVETRSHIKEGRRRYFSAADASRFHRLTVRVIAGSSSLIRYLDSCDPEIDLWPDRPPATRRT